MTVATVDRADLLRRGRLLEVFTIVWNSAEGLVSVALGVMAGSIALVGFGIDSFIETTSGAVPLWRPPTRRAAGAPQPTPPPEAPPLRPAAPPRPAPAASVPSDSIAPLLRKDAPEASLPGIVLAVVSLIV